MRDDRNDVTHPMRRFALALLALATRLTACQVRGLPVPRQPQRSRQRQALQIARSACQKYDHMDLASMSHDQADAFFKDLETPAARAPQLDRQWQPLLQGFDDYGEGIQAIRLIPQGNNPSVMSAPPFQKVSNAIGTLQTQCQIAEAS